MNKRSPLICSRIDIILSGRKNVHGRLFNNRELVVMIGKFKYMKQKSGFTALLYTISLHRKERTHL